MRGGFNKEENEEAALVNNQTHASRCFTHKSADGWKGTGLFFLPWLSAVMTSPHTAQRLMMMKVVVVVMMMMSACVFPARRDVFSYFLLRITKRAQSSDHLTAAGGWKHASRFPRWTCLRQISPRMPVVFSRFPLTTAPEPSRAELSRVMAAGVETVETLPPPGAQQRIRWTLRILHIPAPLDEKGQFCA